MKSFGVVMLSMGLALLVNQGLLYVNGDAAPQRAAWAEDAAATPLESLGGLAALSGGAFLLLLDRERARGHV
jgi:hypothetical protein